MRIRSVAIAFCVAGGTVLFAASPVARVIGTQSISVAGIESPARNAVPVALGDEVSTEAGTAVVQFRDGSNVTLAPKSVLRLEGQSGRTVVRVVEGSVSYDLAPASRVSIVNSRGETVSQILNAAVPTATPLATGGAVLDPLAAVSVYRANRQPGVVIPSTLALTGVFSANGGGSAGSTGARVILPTGLTLNLTATTVNGITTYTIASIEQAVITTTSGVTTTTVLTMTTDNSNSGLIGATVSGLNVTTANPQVNISITPSGSSTPLPAATVQAALQSDVNQAVQTAVNNSQLPAGTTVTFSPVSTGKFSSSSS
jgi:hypothetical protein